jgi:hypothetical protein
MKKVEILAREKFRCPEKGHSGHDGFSHPRCFEKHAKGMYQDKIIFLLI